MLRSCKNSRKKEDLRSLLFFGDIMLHGTTGGGVTVVIDVPEGRSPHEGSQVRNFFSVDHNVLIVQVLNGGG